MASGGIPIYFPDKQQELSVDQKLHMSETIFNAIKLKLTERFGAAMLQEDCENKFTMSWFPKRGGRQAQLTMFVTKMGGVTVEFTRNTIEGISYRYQDNAEIKLISGIHIRIKNNLEKTHMFVRVYPDMVYSPSRSNEQFLLDVIHTILMA